jgi:hypothetical protein
MNAVSIAATYNLPGCTLFARKAAVRVGYYDYIAAEVNASPSLWKTVVGEIN